MRNDQRLGSNFFSVVINYWRRDFKPNSTRLIHTSCIFFRLLCTVGIQLMFNISFAGGSIRTADLWNWKRPLYQLSHNNCPTLAAFSAVDCSRPLFSVWPDWAIYCTLGNFFKACGNNNVGQLGHILGNFCKGVKIFHFSSEIIFGQLY